MRCFLPAVLESLHLRHAAAGVSVAVVLCRAFIPCCPQVVAARLGLLLATQECRTPCGVHIQTQGYSCSPGPDDVQCPGRSEIAQAGDVGEKSEGLGDEE
jgi:hypothetical protein